MPPAALVAWGRPAPPRPGQDRTGTVAAQLALPSTSASPPHHPPLDSPAHPFFSGLQDLRIRASLPAALRLPPQTPSLIGSTLIHSFQDHPPPLRRPRRPSTVDDRPPIVPSFHAYQGIGQPFEQGPAVTNPCTPRLTGGRPNRPTSRPSSHLSQIRIPWDNRVVFSN
ncbi:hypothetical protein M432DRAFT_635891 [Thermoascus aurantiacus ATCC 26904]